MSKKQLTQMTRAEWENVCTQCGKCCLQKIKAFWKVRFTRLACPYLDLEKGACTVYQKRQQVVPECQVLTPENIDTHLKALPKSCAYVWVYKKGCLPPWHKDVSGSAQTVHDMGVSVRDRAIHQTSEHILSAHVVSWEDL